MTIDIDHLRETICIAAESRASGNHPFGALLAGPNGEVLYRSLNSVATDGGTGHAEANAAREAARLYTPDYLSGCTLYTSVEPCCMCAGASYWAGIGTVVYGLTEKRLAELTGDNPENLTLDLECRSVFAAGRRPIEVRGPFPELESEIIQGHRGFW
jgi:tRNA(Arg) A34 adenosine deaminase TadA